MAREGLNAFLKAQQRTIASIGVTVLLASTLSAVSRGLAPTQDDGTLVAAPGEFVDDPTTEFDESTLIQLDDGTIVTQDGTVVGQDGRLTPGGAIAIGTLTPTPVPGGKKPRIKPPPVLRETAQGVTDKTIEIVYYWKGERTQTSPFLKGTAAEGANLDEEKALRAYVDFINKHDADGTTFMGIPINLHGRKLVVSKVLAPKDAGSGKEAYAPIATEITDEIKPFAAVASHGSISSYICPHLAKNKVFNLQTYDLGGLDPDTGRQDNLVGRTDGYCTPAGLTWERQIELTIPYLKQLQQTQYTRLPVAQDRVYGLIYSVYPGLKDVGEAMIQQLRDAGITIAHTARLEDSLATAQTQAQPILAKMREKGVNTLIMPDAGSPLAITHAAEAQQFPYDYYVWPCSGTDVAGMVRLMNLRQWEGARGLTCYDRQFNPDAVNNRIARDTEWWAAYKEMRPNDGDPPSPSPLVYAGLYQLLAGISYAGRDLTPATFKKALDLVPSYRYDSIDGLVQDPTNMLLTLRAPDRSMIGDVGYLIWDGQASEGAATPGAYRYPEDHRYRTEADF